MNGEQEEKKKLPAGVEMATKEKTAQSNIDAKPIHRLPHLSRKTASNMAAGSSVREAKENDMKMSGSRSFMFQTWPSNTHTIINLEKGISRVMDKSHRAFLILGVSGLPDVNYTVKQVLKPHEMLHISSL